MPDLGPLSKTYGSCQGLPLLVGVCGPLIDITKVQHEPRQATCVEKPLKWLSPVLGWDEISGNHQGRVNSDNGELRIGTYLHLPSGWEVGGRLNNGAVVPTSTSISRESSSNPSLAALAVKLANSVPPSMFLALCELPFLH